MQLSEKRECSCASHAIDLLHGRRRIEILCALCTGPVRLGGLVRLLAASKKVLVENLRELEETGIVVRIDLSGSVRHIEYDFSEAARLPMHRLLEQLQNFGQFHQAHIASKTSSENQRKDCARKTTES